MNLPDLKRLTLTGQGTCPVGSRKAPRPKQGERFLRGPIPLPWLSRAARLPGKALHVAIAVYYLAGLKRRRTVALSGKVSAELGVDRHSKYRALKWLEEAGLVRVKRHPGRNPLVTILEVP